MDFLNDNPKEVLRFTEKIGDHVNNLRRTNVEAFQRKIEEAPDIETKSRHMRQLIEENVPASLDLLEMLLKESENDPLLYLEWLSHRQQVAMSVETFEKARQIAERAYRNAKTLYVLERSGVPDEVGYKAYIKACINLLLAIKYQEKLSLVEERVGMPEGVFPLRDTLLEELKDEGPSDAYSVFQMYLEEAQKVAEIEEDTETQNLLQILKGDILLAKGHISTAIDTVFTPLLKEPLLSRKNEGLLKQKFGNACRAAGRWGLSKEYLSQSILIAQEMRDSLSEYDRMTDLGNVYRSEGRIADALKHQQPHMAFAYKRGDLWGLSVACLNMGLSYYSVSPRPDLKNAYLFLSLHSVNLSALITGESEPWVKEMAAKYRAKILSGESTLSEVITNLYSNEGINEFMEDCAATLDDPFDIIRHIPSCTQDMDAIFKLATNSTDKSRKLCLQEKNVSTRGDICRYLGKPDQAIEYQLKDIESAEDMGSDDALAIMQTQLAMDYLLKGDLESAEETVKGAISTLEIIRGKLGCKDSDASKIANFDKNQSMAYSLLQVILCQCKKYAEALAVCELGRSRALTDLIRDKVLQTSEPSAQKDEWIYISDLVSRWEDLVKDIQDDYIQCADELHTNFLVYSVLKEYDTKGNSRYFLYIWLVLNGLSAKGRKDRIHFQKMELSEKIQSELLVDYGFFSSLTRSFADQLEDGAFSESKTKKAVHEEPADEENVINIGMPNGPEVKEFFNMLGFSSVAETDEVVVAASSNQDLRISDESKGKPSSGERAEVILERNLVPGSWDDEGLQQFQQLYDVCVSPVIDLLPEEEEGGQIPSITILPHEFLFGVPFCCLHDGLGKDKRYLVERFEISYSPSLLALRLLNQRLQYLRTKQGSRQLKVLAMGHAIMNLLNFKDLPGSGLEANNVQEVFGPEHCRLALRGDATKQLMLQELQNVDILHVATHASPQDVEEKKQIGDYSMRGCILLSSSDDMCECDGVVRASEIASVDCKCQLVTLSCCETGLGKVTGDGVVGLYRAFFAAGAASVLVTLWKIRDDITRMFMEHFYKEFKATGNVAGSLRSTMVYFIREKKLPPQRWAAFSHIGAAL